MTGCTTTGCHNPGYARGLCRRHYNQAHQRGRVGRRVPTSTITPRLRELLHHGWTRQDIAAHTGVSPHTVQVIVAGKRDSMDPATASKLDTLPRRYTLVLPWDRPPLRSNDRQHHMARARTTRQVRETIAWLGKQQHMTAGRHLTVQLHYAPGTNRRMDAHNLHPTVKACVDALATPTRRVNPRKPGSQPWIGLQLVPDDTADYVTVFEPRIHPASVPGPRCWLDVEVTL